jgi:hypothetical protein
MHRAIRTSAACIERHLHGRLSSYARLLLRARIADECDRAEPVHGDVAERCRRAAQASRDPRRFRALVRARKSRDRSERPANDPRFRQFPTPFARLRISGPGRPVARGARPRAARPDPGRARRIVGLGPWNVVGAHARVRPGRRSRGAARARRHARARGARGARAPARAAPGRGRVDRRLRERGAQSRGDAQSRPYDWATRFEERIAAAALAGDEATLCDLDGPDAVASAPSVEHYLPMLYAFAQRRRATTILARGIEAASLSMLSLRFD